MKKKISTIASGLRFQLVIILVAVLAVVLSVSFYVQYFTSLQILREQREKDAVSAFMQAETNVNALLDNLDRISLSTLMDDSSLAFLHVDMSNRLSLVEAQTGLYKRIDTTLATYTELNALLIFMEDGRVGGSSIPRTYFKYDSNSSKSQPFYSTEIYSKAMANKGGVLWFGGYTRYLFYSPTPSEQDGLNQFGPTQDDKLIIGARTIQLPQVKGRIVLVACIKESALYALYEKLMSTSNNRVFIVDNTGKMISGVMGKSFGQKVTYYNQIDSTKSYGSFMQKQDGISMQIVYYKLNHLGWVMINEVPVDTYERDMIRMRTSLILTSIGALSLISVLYAIWMRRLTRPLEKLARTMSLVSGGNLNLRVDSKAGSKEISLLNMQFNKMLDDIKQLVGRNELMEQEKRKLEIEALQYQINPHFIYNTITVIRWMATMAKANHVSNALLSFANVLRPVFNNAGITWSINQEIEFTRNYISIMNYRFGGSILFEFTVEEFSDEYVMPRFLLQPLIENAITHGIAGKNDGVITISAEQQDDTIVLCVKDNGIGIEQGQLEALQKVLDSSAAVAEPSPHTIGLYNVDRRIRLHFNKKSGLEITSCEGAGTTVVIVLPKEGR